MDNCIVSQLSKHEPSNDPGIAGEALGRCFALDYFQASKYLFIDKAKLTYVREL